MDIFIVGLNEIPLHVPYNLYGGSVVKRDGMRSFQVWEVAHEISVPEFLGGPVYARTEYSLN